MALMRSIPIKMYQLISRKEPEDSSDPLDF